MENTNIFDSLKAVMAYIWCSNSKVVLTAGIIALAVGYISGSSSVVLGAWITIAIMSTMSLIYTEKRVKELEQSGKK